MRPVPIPDGVAEASGGRRVVYAAPDGSLIDDDIRPCEAVVTPDAISMLIELDDDDRVSAAAGLPIWLTILGAALPPFSLAFADPADPEPDGQWPR